MKKKIRIIHICLFSHYTENMTYQDNLLSQQNKLDGHDVLIVADCNYYDKGILKKKSPEDKILDNGVRLVRLEFFGKFLPNFIKNKLGIAIRLKNILRDFRPNIIFYHGIQGLELLTIGAYKNENVNVKIFIDSHADINNSTSNPIFTFLLHKVFNKYLYKSIENKVDKVFYVSIDSMEFIKKHYDIKDCKLDFMPLGGIIKEEEDRIKLRNKIRALHMISDKNILFTHSGKLDNKKKTLELLRSFSKINNDNYRLIIIGVFDESIKNEAMKIVDEDSRILFVGWKSGTDLVDYLCASDCYMQPGSQSATLQVALCCGLPVMIYPHKSHYPFVKDNGYYISSEKDIIKALINFDNSEAQAAMRKSSVEISKSMLDYSVLARKMYK